MFDGSADENLSNNFIAHGVYPAQTNTDRVHSPRHREFAGINQNSPLFTHEETSADFVLKDIGSQVIGSGDIQIYSTTSLPKPI